MGKRLTLFLVVVLMTKATITLTIGVWLVLLGGTTEHKLIGVAFLASTAFVFHKTRLLLARLDTD